MEYELGYSTGIFIGLFAGLMLVSILIRLMRKNHGLKGEYDERQELIRGRGFKIGFFTFLIGIAAVTVLNGFLADYVSCTVLNFTVLCVSVLCYACYCIWNEAYFALNDNPKSFLIISGVIGIINLAGGISPFLRHTVVLSDPLPKGVLNLMCGLLFTGIFLTLGIKQLVTKEED